VNSLHNPCGITQIGDPFVLHASDGKYYFYPTSHTIDEMGFDVYESDDFTHWKDPVVCYHLSDRSFGFKNCWAPEVKEYQGKFYLYYTARWKINHSLRIGVAVADKPTGPFVEVYDNRPMFDPHYAAIDGDCFIDDDGRKYLYFSRDCCDNVYEGEHQSHIYVIELNDDMVSVKGEPHFLFGPTKAYESHFILGNESLLKWNEGPFMVKINGEYHLMYSANFFASKYYSICCAKGKSPLGPFVKYDAPIATYVEGKVSGPGHNSVFKDDQGQLWCAHHVHTSLSEPGNNRQLFIDRLEYHKGLLTMKITYND
jgi:beta-xylosidase